MQPPILKAIARLSMSTILCSAALAADASAKSAVPGTLNYVEGQASIGTEALDSKSIGSAQLQTGESLTTGNGKAEVLLTPGVFLRVGSDSSVKMISPGLTNTDISLDHGHAMVEVAEIHSENDIRISAGGTTTELLKTGLYDFDLRQSELRVYDGKADVMENGQHTTVKGGHEVSLIVNATLKPQKFDKKQYEEGDLYRWSSLRSAYLAEANVNAAGIYAENGWGPWGPGWWGADWYWDPWFGAYTFIPGDSIFYSPFGWGFYSPWWVYQAPLFYGYGYGYRPYYHHFSTDYRNWGPGSHYVEGSNYAHGIYRGPGSTGGGFRSGPATARSVARTGGGSFNGGGFHDGGFHGGVGFHGGGGFHGR
jgi:FecR protein